MTRQQWDHVERLYHEALERPPDERAAFVGNGCDGDAEVRAEVESLLAFEPHARGFIETPPLAKAPGRLVGTVIGAYRLESLIAAGGMGEVYRARDTRLDRVVAIKILLEQFAADADRRDRFQREARIVSSLNHPHICALYDVGMHEEARYLVMEYLEGETLHDRIQRGPVPTAEALAALTQIADALDRAHQHGIVHRDLKPGNVMWTKSGVKLLDFGLAQRSQRLVTREAIAEERSRTLTAAGTIMGTFPYMAPEQLQGLPTDARTDIFAFGAVAYEMLTGRRAFEASSQAALIGAILRDEPPPMAAVAPSVPAPLARTVMRCLAKDPGERWQSANDLAFQLRSLTMPDESVVVPPRERVWPRIVERGIWIALTAAAAIAGATWMPRRALDRAERPPPSPSVVFSVSPARGTSLAGFFTPFAVSPDGKSLVYAAATDDGVNQLRLRSLDSEKDRLLPGTEDASTPFWSPDSQWVGFFAARSLKKVRVSSGVTQTIAADMMSTGGGSWGVRDDILFPHPLLGLTRVSAVNGRVSKVAVERGNQFSPQFLSDGHHFIYAATGRSAVAVSDLDAAPPRTVMTLPVGTTSVAYSRGYVFYVQDGALFARPFDESRLELTGKAVEIASGVPAGIPSRSPFSVSESGVLAFWTDPLGAPAVLSWFDRTGGRAPAVSAPAKYRGFALAPDDEQLVFARIGKTGSEDLWVRRLSAGTETQLTFNGASFMPLWSPDGSHVAYSGYAIQPPPNAYVKTMNNDRAASIVGDSPFPTFATSWTPDGQAIILSHTSDLPGHNNLWLQRLAGGAADRLWFNTPANQFQGKIAPNGRGIAYVADDSGSNEVWIASYPSIGVKHQVSRGGGDFPQWAGDELFFVGADRQLMAARVTTDAAGLHVAAPQPLFRMTNLVDTDPLIVSASNPFVPDSAGRRFLVAERAPDPAAAPMTVVVNWPSLLK